MSGVWASSLRSLSRHSPTGHACMSSWLIAHAKKAGMTLKPPFGVHNRLWTKVIPAMRDNSRKNRKPSNPLSQRHSGTTGTNTIFTTCAMRHSLPLTAKKLYLPWEIGTKINHKTRLAQYIEFVKIFAQYVACTFLICLINLPICFR